MGNMVKELDLMLIKQQGTFGTPEAALAGSDVIECVGTPSLKINGDMEDLETISGGGFGQDASVPGAFYYDISGKLLLRSGGATVAGQFDAIMKLCGFGVTTALDVHTYTPLSKRSDYKDATIWGYSGDLSTDSAILYKSGNVIFAPKFTFAASKPGYLDFSGKGIFGGIPADATQPSITKQGNMPPVLQGATISINGYAYCVLSADIDIGLEVTLGKCPSETYGMMQSVIVNRKIKWTAKMYRVIAATNDPIATWVAGTTAPWSLAYGSNPNGLTIASTAAQITNVDSDDDDGIETHTLSGLFKDNDFSVVLDTTAA